MGGQASSRFMDKNNPKLTAGTNILFPLTEEARLLHSPWPSIRRLASGTTAPFPAPLVAHPPPHTSLDSSCWQLLTSDDSIKSTMKWHLKNKYLSCGTGLVGALVWISFCLRSLTCTCNLQHYNMTFILTYWAATNWEWHCSSPQWFPLCHELCESSTAFWMGRNIWHHYWAQKMPPSQRLDCPWREPKDQLKKEIFFY